MIIHSKNPTCSRGFLFLGTFLASECRKIFLFSKWFSLTNLPPNLKFQNYFFFYWRPVRQKLPYNGRCGLEKQIILSLFTKMFTSSYPSINCEDVNSVKFQQTSKMNSVSNCCNSEKFYHGFGNPTGKYFKISQMKYTNHIIPSCSRSTPTFQHKTNSISTTKFMPPL